MTLFCFYKKLKSNSDKGFAVSLFKHLVFTNFFFFFYIYTYLLIDRISSYRHHLTLTVWLHGTSE